MEIIMYKSELEIAFLKWFKYPGEMLSVLDNETDYPSCKEKTHCNSILTSSASNIFYNKTTDTFEFGTGYSESGTAQAERVAELLKEHGMFAHVFAGYRNNPWFSMFPKEMQEKQPDSFMQDREGNLICLFDSTIRQGEAVAMPAVDDISILSFSAENIKNATKVLKDNLQVKGWIAGSEESYPEYFALSFGDFRADFIKHFQAWLKSNGKDENVDLGDIQAGKINKQWFAWMNFREQAMADRASYFTKNFLSNGVEQPIFYPTHGNLFCNDTRWKLGQTPSSMVGSCDGLEMGHISIDDDDERVNTLSVTHFTSFGAPVIVPRLGNRTVDFTAQGLGRSFTPVMMRRLVYECVGMGISHIGPIHWRSILHDGEWFIKGTAAEAESRRVFDEINDAAYILNSMTKLQAQVGLFLSNAAWIEKWNPKWTGFFQDSQSAHWNLTTVVDEQLSKDLEDKVSVMISIDNNRINEKTIYKLLSYLNVGGKVIAIGGFAMIDENCRNIDAAVRNELINHKNVIVLEDCHDSEKRKLTNEFLSHKEGSFKVHHEYYPVSLEKVEDIIKNISPSCIMKPAKLAAANVDILNNMNVYTLTDRSSLLYVLINNTDKELEFDFATSEKLKTLSGYDGFIYYDVADKLIIGRSDSILISLPANATKMIWVYPDADAAVMEAKIKNAANLYQLLKMEKYDIDSYKNMYHFINSTEKFEMRLQKSFTLANSILNSIFMQFSMIQGNDSVKLKILARDSDMKKIDNAEIKMRIIPSEYRHFHFTEEQEGEYQLVIKKKSYPKIYNYYNQKYENIEGEVRIIVTAKTSHGLAGGFIKTISL